jgi:hypothetical protein
MEEIMRIPMLVATAIVLTAGAGTATAAPTMDVPYLVAATLQDPAPPAQPKSGDVSVDVDLGSDRTVWYTDPLWIVLGAAAVIVVVALVAAAARGGGGGTTVIR